ncbi:dehydrogenase [Paenibacillus swuensis]|uniref:Dehydrogenase n=1 Tax=Paenibacillus swuensis TaxID=1178515 RepID=A0A172TMH4_9BACL|nr:galactitol-1-phosphate 5-dehydrogenase [Paenibacillus swuensis]ANE48241.1 dehydrogenase [Paenibacillus swuensis]
MKAAVLHGISDLRVEDIGMPSPGAGEVLVKVRACGVCGSDIPRVFTKGTYSFPTVPGHEFAGEISAVGEGVDASLIGMRAAVFPLLPCRSCPSCEIGDYATCSNYDYMGSRSDGAFAEYIACPLWNIVPAPAALSYEEIAMAEPAAVAIHALRQAKIDIGDAVFISGAGPIGIMLGLWAKAWGASRVLLADIDPEKLAFAREQGFEHTVNAFEQDVQAWVRSVTNDRGADVCVEGAGSSPSWENCLKAARSGGRVVLMGNPAGEMKLSQNGYWEILRKQLTVSGTWNSSYASMPKNEWKLALDFMVAGRLNLKGLITHRTDLDGLREAMEMMRDRTAFYNKVMYTNLS